jgi:AcrR family transcriptional regulator
LGVRAASPKPFGADKANAIIDAALDLFRQYGYRRTSMEDIARAANVAKGTLYIYFKSKDELFEALARQLAARIDEGLTAVMERELPLEDKVLALLDAKLGFVYRWVLSSPHAAELTDPTQRLPEDVFGPVDRDFRAALARILKDGVKQGKFSLKSSGLTPETAVDTLIAAAHGAERGACDETDFRERMERITRLGLRGLRSR